MHGVKQMQRRIAMVQARLEKSATRALTIEANAVMRHAKSMAPYDGGDLRDSGTAHPVARQGMEFVSRLTFGEFGPSSEYALTLHETPSPHDPPSWIGKVVTFHTPGTSPKYLETPLLNAVAGMDSRIAGRMKL